MPLYEFYCQACGCLFELLLRMGEEKTNCPECGSGQVLKVPSVFSFRDAFTRKKERERAILKRARAYLLDGKVSEARRLLEKAKEYHPTEGVKRLSDSLTQGKRRNK